MSGARIVVFVICALMGSRVQCSGVEVPKLKLNNGRDIPAIALGTYLGFDQIFPQSGILKSQTTKQCDVILKAIDVGYRHFDTAAIYETEQDIGEAVRKKVEEGVVKREDIFITTKLWNTHHKREEVAQALRNTLSKMGVDYIDLYLMHWPMALNADYTQSDVDYIETWRGMEDVVKLGLAKSIGLSNFNIDQVKRVIKEGTIKPAVLQIEIHPQIIQTELVDFAQSEGLVVMGYSPFGSLVARHGYYFPGPKMNDPVLSGIANNHNKTVPQIVLRWLIDRKIIPIPKTVKVKRLTENIEVFDFHLTDEEKEQINKFDTNTRYTYPSFWQTHPYYPFEKIENVVDNPFRQ